jgi:hypothetical protein
MMVGCCAAYCDDIVGIGAVKVWYADAWWKRLLAFKCLVEAFAELWLDAQCLEDKDAHAHKALLGRVVALINGIVQNQDDKVVGSVGVDDERAEALVALQSLPEEHDHLGRPGQRLVAAGEIRRICLELAGVSQGETW